MMNSKKTCKEEFYHLSQNLINKKLYKIKKYNSQKNLLKIINEKRNNLNKKYKNKNKNFQTYSKKETNEMTLN